MPKLITPCLFLLQLATIASADEPLPRVLVLGDSIYGQPAGAAARELKGRVEVAWRHSGDSSSALARLDELLGTGEWDVIHFNFGLADLHYRDPSTSTIRAMSKHAGGVRVTSPEQYEQNLQQLVKRLKATGAKLIWASTTPITCSKDDPLYDPGSEIQYNAIAARVMADHKVTINDMHAWVLENVKDNRAPSPFGFNRVPIHPPIVQSIISKLNLPRTIRSCPGAKDGQDGEPVLKQRAAVRGVDALDIVFYVATRAILVE